MVALSPENLETWLAAAIATGGLVILAMGIALTRRLRQSASTPIVRDDQPADGVVDFVVLASSRGVPNSADPRIARFVGLDSLIATGPSSPSSRARDGLRGRLTLLSIFLGRDGTAWTDNEIAQAHRFLAKAGEWIEREAQAWSVPLKVAIPMTYFATTDDEPRALLALVMAHEEYRSGLFHPEETSRVLAACSAWAQQIAYRDLAEFHEEIVRRVETDHLLWLIHSRSSGRSEWVDGSETGLGGLGVAVCYAREADAPGPLPDRPYLDPVTVVHELLHAFGASDKYGTSLRRFEPADVSDRDIMRLDSERLSQVRIDPLTAREIGWYRGGSLPEAIQKRTRRTSSKTRGGSV